MRITQDIKRAAHGVAMPHITKAGMEAWNILLPPFPEQKRIADKLDTLFARVDACRERLDRVPTILKRFRQSVLDSAMCGRLTEDWRHENQSAGRASDLLAQIAYERSNRGLPSARRTIGDEGIDIPLTELPPNWSWCRVGQIADVRLGGTPARNESSFWSGNIPWVSSGEVSNCRIRDTAEKITSAGMANSNAKLYPKGSVLIAMIGEGKTRGQSALLEIDATTNQNVACLVFDVAMIEPEFVWFWALGEYERNRSVGRGGNQPALNGAKVRALPLPLPPLEEQRVIVQRVSSLFEIADEFETRSRNALAVVEQLTPSLLAKAFRGELVPQDPDDEPASVLLERIQPERAATRQFQPRRGQRTAPKKPAESAKSSSTPTRDSSPQTAPARPRRPSPPEPKLKDTAAAPDRRPIEDYTTDEMMSHFRAASRASGEMTEEGLFHLVLARLGFERLGAKVTPILKGHLKAAIGRGIIERDGFFVRGKTPTIKHYERSTLVDALTSVMRKNHPYDREEVIQALAVHLGYSSVSDVMRDTMKSVFNSAIRQGVLIREGSTIRRAD